MKYFVHFVGHIVPEYWILLGKEVYYDVVWEGDKVDGEGGLKQFYNQTAFLFVAQQGMNVLKNTNEMLDDTQGPKFDKRMYVPIHCIAYIDGTVRRIEEPRPPELLLVDDGPEEQSKVLKN